MYLPVHRRMYRRRIFNRLVPIPFRRRIIYQSLPWIRSMILNNRRNLRNDNIHVSFRDVTYYNLLIYKSGTADAGSVYKLKYFRGVCKRHPLKHTEAHSYFAIWRWCKINYVKYIFKAFIVSYDYDVEHDGGRAGNV